MKIDFKGLLIERFRVACALSGYTDTDALETIIGPVEIRRRYYRDRETGEYVFLPWWDASLFPPDEAGRQ